MNISIFGLGYVGAVTAGCLAERGHKIYGVDVQEAKVDLLNSGKAPILEPKLSELLSNAHSLGRLSAGSDVRTAVQATDISILCVGTPSLASGGLDLRFAREACKAMAGALGDKPTRHLLLIRSTMLPGSTKALAHDYFCQLMAERKLQIVYCPEFLREGTAVEDFRRPSLRILGSENGQPVAEAEEAMGASEWLNWEGAELVKYSCNYWHGLKVAFANEIGSLSKCVGADGRRIMSLLCSDTTLNVSDYYMKPGNPFGGSCLPKDISALSCFAGERGQVMPLLDAVSPANRAHAERLRQIVSGADAGKILIVGLSFKKDTDDLRNSPMVSLAESLLSDGREITIYDPYIETRHLVGANLAQVSRRIPPLAELLVQDLPLAVSQACCVVVSNKVVPIEVIREHIRPTALLVDVNGWNELERLSAKYRGMCW
jgi:GDP-mannose 6-dehydrogenase